MEQKKKSTCCCFSFFRRKSSKSPAIPVQSSIQPSHYPEVPSDDNQSRSFTSSQKLVPGHNFRSCIVTPIRRTPNLQKFLNSKLNQSSELNYTIETSISRPNTLKENLLNGCKASPAKVLNANLALGSANHEKMSKEQLRTELRIVTEEVLKSIDSNYVNKLVKGPFFVKSPGPSPDFLGRASATQSIGSFAESPIKNVDCFEDYSDIETIFMNTERFRRLPDVFIRAQANVMPKIKPTTPAHCTMRKVLPVVRKENRLLFNKFNCQ